MFKKCIVLGFLVLFTQPCFAEESITITTYYPSPYGVYKTLRLYPNTDHASGDACTNTGEMFFNDSVQQVLVCNGNTHTWQAINARSYSTCIGVCSSSNWIACPNGEGYTMVASSVGKGCSGGSLPTGTGLPGEWRVRTCTNNYACGPDAWEELDHGGSAVCTVTCGSTDEHNNFLQTYESSQAVCCK